MLVLVAVNEPNNSLDLPSTRSMRSTVEGELVVPSLVGCTHGPDCACNRTWTGLASDGATTVAMVADRPGVSEIELRNVIGEHLVRIGTVGADLADLIDDQVRVLDLIASSYPKGAHLTRLGALVSRCAHAA